MSGGVDSSVAAAALAQQGFEVIGLFMRTGVEASGARSCCSVADAHDARRVADTLGIAFYALNFQEQFRELIDFFCAEYDRGRTPNPCILCNQQLKFGRLLQYARQIEAEYVATGHYARVVAEGGRFVLKRALREEKDQSYVLFPLTQEQLSQTLLPVGERTKAEIRQEAARLGLGVKDKPESQEICFVPDDDYGRLLRERMPERVRPGPIVDTQGNVLGEHPGVQLFTVGQRRGLGIALGSPRYVVEIRRESNTLVIGADEDLLRHEMTVSEVNWVALAEPPEPVAAQVQIRYNHRPVPATVYPQGAERARVQFERPVRAVTPGQAAVFYDGDTVLGGGWID